MTFNEVLEVSGAILATLGGGAVIVFGFSSWLGKVWASRLMEQEKANHSRELERLRSELTHDTEAYKVKLKKSEFIFQREFDAGSEFVALLRSILPSFSRPEMDWGDACIEMAQDFHKTEKRLDAFLSTHGAILGEGPKSSISQAMNLAAEGKFDVEGPEVRDSAVKKAEEMHNHLADAEEQLLDQIRSQVST